MMGSVMTTVTVWVMATVTEMALVMHGNGKGNGYGNGYGNSDGKGEALSVESVRIVVRDVPLRSRCTQHCCDTHLCGKVPNMLLLTSSFSCILVCTAAFVNGKKRAMAMATRVVGKRQHWQ